MSSKVKEWTVLSMLEWGTDYFSQRDIPDARLSIEWLLADVLNLKRLDLYLKYDRPLAPSELEELRPLVKRRAAHEPLQYIVGYTNFMGARIQVTPDVLIPRMETEQLVEIILDHNEDSTLHVLDIGTGSGCIPIALKMERPSWEISAVDIYEPALELAQHNAAQNEVSVNFVKGDLFSWQKLAFDKQFDIIVSNPPYVLPEEKNNLEPQVVDHEPAVALFCENIRKMYGHIRQAAEYFLVEKGILYLEIHKQHDQLILDLFDSESWSTSLLKDYDGNPRFVIAEKQ